MREYLSILRIKQSLTLKDNKDNHLVSKHFVPSVLFCWHFMASSGRKALVPLMPTSIMQPWSSTLSTHPLNTWITNKIKSAYTLLKNETEPFSWRFIAHHSSFYRSRGEILVEQLWIDGQLDAEQPSFSYMHLGNNTSEQHARLEKVHKRADLLRRRRRFQKRIKEFIMSRTPLVLTEQANLRVIAWIQLLTEQLGVRVTDVPDAQVTLQATR